MPKYLNIDAARLKAEDDYWTAREICQQPEAWMTVHADAERQRARIDGWLGPKLADSRLRIVLSGAGSSSFVGETLAPWLRSRLGRRADAVSTTDLVGCPSLYFSEDVPTLMISFARSGDSPESAASVDLADRMLGECHHLLLTCNRDSRLAKTLAGRRDALCLWMPENTNDHSFAMTSSFTSMLVSCAALFAPELTRLNPAVESTRFVIANLVDRARELARVKFDRLVVLGAGCLLATAREACLKCLELTNGRVMAMADSPLGFRHGPKAVIDENTCVLLLRSADPYTARYDLDLLLEMCSNARAAKIVVLSPDDFGGDHPHGARQSRSAIQSADPVAVDRLLALRSNGQAEVVVAGPGGLGGDPPEIDDFWASLPYVVFCQMFAFFKARALGVGADNPCPGGEVNRVVQGVRIHAYRG